MDQEANDPRAALVYSEAVRTLEQQQAVVESVRVRAGILLSAAAIATAFLSGLALTTAKLDAWGWGATVGFVGMGGLCLMILQPTRRWTFRSNAKKLARDYLDTDPPCTLAEMHRELALHMENWAEGNSRKMRKLFNYFQVASFLLGAEVILWITALWRR